MGQMYTTKYLLSENEWEWAPPRHYHCRHGHCRHHYHGNHCILSPTGKWGLIEVECIHGGT